MNIAQIRDLDVANGKGIRATIFVSGCTHKCFNCFNEEYQDYSYGEKISDKHVKKIQKMLSNKRIKGLSILGGEPMDHPIELQKLISKLNFRNDQDIWLWSGYELDEILLDTDKTNLLKNIDVLVDGLYVERLKDLNLKFRGSSNQRVINVKDTLKNKKIILLEDC